MDDYMNDIMAYWTIFNKDQVVQDLASPEEAKHWEWQCGEAANKLRWIAEAVTKAGTFPPVWDTASMNYEKANNLGLMSEWFLRIDAELQKMVADRAASDRWPGFKSVRTYTNEIIQLTKGIAR